MIEGYGQWAEHYRRALWTGVLPLPPRQKTWPPKDYTGRKATRVPDDQQIAEWTRTHANGNLCLRMPSDVIGIDVDDYEYEYHARDPETKEPLYLPDGAPDMRIGVKTGNVTLGELEDELGELPPTWRSSSRGDGPSGIRFYRVPPGLLWGDFGQHLECIWWGHRYAVVWPSASPDSGLRYLWINDADDDPMWGSPPPKVTDLPELPDSWVARFGRAQDTPKLPASVAARESPRFLGSDGARQFTRQQAEDYVRPHLEDLAAATTGTINNKLNAAAKVLSHFIPTFWNEPAAWGLLLAAVRRTAYDGKTWSAEKTIASAFDSAVGDWHAELIPEPHGWATRTQIAPRPRWDAHEPTEAPDDPPEPPEASGFWDARPALVFVRDFALSRYAAPWAVLGATLARTAACVEPNIQLPAVIGTEASLNLFVGLVGRSGGGKDIATGVSEALLLPIEGRDTVPLDIIPLGSGEGLSHVYMKMPPKLPRGKGRAKPDEDSEAIGLGAPAADGPIQYRTRALISVSEIDTLGSLSERRGSTVGGQLRQAWSGGQLGFQYATDDRRMIVQKHTYRMCLVAGIQPGRAGTLLEETDGGTPQRFLWLPAQERFDEPTDEQIDNPPPPIPGSEWTPPRYQGGQVLFDVCAAARRTIVRAHIARGRGDGDALDGHSLLNRLKTAAAIALLCGDSPRRQCEITEEDWELAGAVMAVSDRTREGVQRHLADTARQENEKRAYAEAQKAIVVTETVETDEVRKARRWLAGRIGPDWVKVSDLRNSTPKSAFKKHVGPLLDEMERAGEIESGTYVAGRNPGRQVRRRSNGE